MSHNHTHTHGQDHHHAANNIALAFLLNTGFAIIELIGGLLTNSVAILSDSLHDLGDSLSLGTAWYFQKKSNRTVDQDYTYGYRRFSLLGAFVNSIVLLAGSVFIIKESVERLFTPEQADAKGMLILALIGILVNAAAMLRLKKGRSINEKLVSLHFLEDVLGWVAVLIGSVIMLFADLPVLDPILSLLIACFVLFNVYRNIKPAFRIILQGAPGTVSRQQVEEIIQREKEVSGIHDLRIWTLDGEHHILSVHVVVKNLINIKQAEYLKERIKKELEAIAITHATIEVEYSPEHR